ncbi:hypothetical protein GBA52_020205 [Prunus armeniaca]|nr:hypothetical protein GBA52_020205 [Prunus armeniaca]
MLSGLKLKVKPTIKQSYSFLGSTKPGRLPYHLRLPARRVNSVSVRSEYVNEASQPQEITQGVRSSTRAVRVAEERLRRLTNMAPSASVQEVTSPKTEVPGPVLARTARGIREGIVKGRALWQMFFTITRFSRLALNYITSRNKR